MPPLKLNELVVSSLVAQLTSDLPNQIAAINAETQVQADGYTIQAPAQVYDYIPPPEVLDGGGYPAIGIEDDVTKPEVDAGSFGIWTHRLAVVYFLVNPDHQALVRQLRRYGRAITSSALLNRSLPAGGGVGQSGSWGTRFIQSIPGPTLGHELPEQVKTYIGFAGVLLEFREDE